MSKEKHEEEILFIKLRIKQNRKVTKYHLKFLRFCSMLNIQKPSFQLNDNFTIHFFLFFCSLQIISQCSFSRKKFNSECWIWVRDRKKLKITKRMRIARKKSFANSIRFFSSCFFHSQWRINLEGMSWGNWDWRGKQITDFD